MAFLGQPLSDAIPDEPIGPNDEHFSVERVDVNLQLKGGFLDVEGQSTAKIKTHFDSRACIQATGRSRVCKLIFEHHVRGNYF